MLGPRPLRLGESEFDPDHLRDVLSEAEMKAVELAREHVNAVRALDRLSVAAKRGEPIDWPQVADFVRACEEYGRAASAELRERLSLLALLIDEAGVHREREHPGTWVAQRSAHLMRLEGPPGNDRAEAIGEQA